MNENRARLIELFFFWVSPLSLLSRTKDRKKQRLSTDTHENLIPLKKRKHTKYPYEYNIDQNAHICLKSHELAIVSSSDKKVTLQKGDTVR